MIRDWYCKDSRFVPPGRAQCAGEKTDCKKGMLFPYSKSIGVFNVGIGVFSIRFAE